MDIEDRHCAEDLYRLKLWRESEPEAPDGEWFKDFGSFKICRQGKFPKTFLMAPVWLMRGQGLDPMEHVQDSH